MIDGIFILSGLGEVLIEKHYRHGISRNSIADLFWERATTRKSGDDEFVHQDNSNENEIPPVVSLRGDPSSPSGNGHFAVHVKRGDLTFVAGISRDTQPMMAIEFLHRVADVLTDYLGVPDEVKIKDAFSTVYQILDEMMDGGMCLVTEYNSLRGMIAPPTVANKVKAVMMGGAAASSVSSVLPLGAVSTNPWRDKSISYLQNEIFLDIEEMLDCVMTSEDEVVSADIRGAIKMTTRLTGMPEVLLQFEDSSVLGDVSFHPCVRVDRWERENVLSFVPPDGQFELMRYRAAQKVIAPSLVPESVPFYCRPSVTIGSSSNTSPSGESNHHQQGRMEILVGPRKRFFGASTAAAAAITTTVEDVCVRLPLPLQAKFLQAKANEGKCGFMDRNCVWTIGTLDLNKTALRLTGSFAIIPNSTSAAQSVVANSTLPTTCNVDFSVTAKPVSGLKVGSLEITNQTYKFFKGVRSVLKAGEFQIRC